MSALPERYQRYADARQPAAPRPGEVELSGERDPIVHTVDAYGQPIQLRRSQLPAYERPVPRDLTPQPLFDPIAQRRLATGVGGGVLLWGGGQFLVGASALVSGLAGVAPVVLALALVLYAARGRRPGSGGDVHVTNHVRGFGRANTRL